MTALRERFASFDYLDECVYVTDVETYDLVYANPTAVRNMVEAYTPGEPGKKCYRCIQGLRRPCVFCNQEELLAKGQCLWHKLHPVSGHRMLIHDTLLEIDGRQYRLEVAVEAERFEGKDFDKAPDDIQKYYNYLTACIRRLVKSDRFDEAVDAVLQTILYFYQADRAYLFEVDLKSQLWDNTFEICASGITPEIDHLKNLSIESVSPFWVESFFDNRMILIEDMDEVAKIPGREAEAGFLAAQGIRTLFAIPIFSDQNHLTGFLGVDNPRTNMAQSDFLKNVTYFVGVELDKQRVIGELRNLTLTDQLTGLANRHAWNEFLKTADGVREQKLGVAFIDVNGLKYVNDTFGHSYGDRYLKTLADRLRKTCHEQKIFRVSGDEFVVVDQNRNYDDFKKDMHVLRASLSEGKNDIAAIGFLWDNAEVSVSSMVRQAEQLMYAEKRKHYDMLPEEHKARPSFADTIVEAFRDAEYMIYLQPKKDLRTGRVYGAEALVRKRGEDGQVHFPAGFIAAMEQENIVSIVDYFVFEKVCETVKRWNERGLTDFIISTNFSRRTMAEIDYLERMESILSAHGLTGRNIVIEITEAAKLVHMEKLHDITVKLTEMGFRIALDDVGTDYSALDMLELETLSMVKLDKGLTKRVQQLGRKEVIVRNMIHLCHELGLECVAEGVETQEQLERLKQAGCDRIQGYLIDRPMSVEDFEAKYLPAEK